MDEERTLADEPSTERDVTVPPTPEDFDLGAWVRGIRPTRRAVKLHPGGHLVARLEQIADEIDATPDGADVDALIDEFQSVKEQIETGVWFVVEKRSSEWEKQFRKDLTKQLRLNLSNSDDLITAALHQLTEQIVQPEGVTVDHLRAMLDANEGELNKLIMAMQNANTQLAENAGVLTRDFSARRSATTPG